MSLATLGKATRKRLFYEALKCSRGVDAPHDGFPFALGVQFHALLNDRNRPVHGDDHDDEIGIFSGEPQRRVEPGSPGSILPGDGVTVQKTGKSVKVQIRPDMERPVELCQGLRALGCALV